MSKKDFRFLQKLTISSGRFPHPRPLPEGEGRGEGFHGQGRSIMLHDNWEQRNGDTKSEEGRRRPTGVRGVFFQVESDFHEPL